MWPSSLTCRHLSSRDLFRYASFPINILAQESCAQYFHGKCLCFWKEKKIFYMITKKGESSLNGTALPNMPMCAYCLKVLAVNNAGWWYRCCVSFQSSLRIAGGIGLLVNHIWFSGNPGEGISRRKNLGVQMVSFLLSNCLWHPKIFL